MIRALIKYVTYGIVYEQGNCLDVRDISEKNTVFYMLSFNTQASGALIFAIIVVAENKPMDLYYRCYI